MFGVVGACSSTTANPPTSTNHPYTHSTIQAFIFDGRNIMDHEALRKIGFEVYAIGKPRTKEW